jgi:hypothetical protein
LKLIEPSSSNHHARLQPKAGEVDSLQEGEQRHVAVEAGRNACRVAQGAGPRAQARALGRDTAAQNTISQDAEV